MYVTRPLSQLLKYPEILSEAPDGPNSGFLVIQDEESLTYSCFGCCRNRTLTHLPFPQDKELIVQYIISTGQSTSASLDPLFLIPALNQPLSSNRYYAILPHANRIGEAITCSREEDKRDCCFCRCIKDVKPRPLDPRNVYQQIAIVPYESLCSSAGQFTAESIASDGFPPYFLRREGWTIYTKTSPNCKLDAAQGIHTQIRARIPEIDLSSSFVVGKWYCPFVFVKDGTLRDQVKKSIYYEMTLERRWEQIYSCRNNNNQNSVVIDGLIEKEQVLVDGSKAVWDEKEAVNGVIWFTSMGKEKRVGLRVEIVERMKWEARRGGWEESATVEELKGRKEWSELRLYAMVERFNLRRMDESLVMSYDFRHLDKTNSRWD